MRILINRYPRACFNVERAMSKAQKCTAQLTGMPGGGSGSTIADAVDLVMQAKEARDAIAAEIAGMRAELSPKIEALADPHVEALLLIEGIPPVAVFKGLHSRFRPRADLRVLRAEIRSEPSHEHIVLGDPQAGARTDNGR